MQNMKFKKDAYNKAGKRKVGLIRLHAYLADELKAIEKEANVNELEAQYEGIIAFLIDHYHKTKDSK